jgi:hypothetical protein
MAENETATRVWTFLHSKSWITWIGHALLMVGMIVATVVFGATGTGAVLLGYFAVRETMDLKKGSPPFDCILDFTAPALVYLLYVRFLA